MRRKRSGKSEYKLGFLCDLCVLCASALGLVTLSYSKSSILRGQLFFNNRDSARSASILPPVWQRAQ